MVEFKLKSNQKDSTPTPAEWCVFFYRYQKYENAYKTCESAVQSGVKTAEVYEAFGGSAFYMKKLDVAEQNFSSALGLNPQSVTIGNNLAVTRILNGKA